MKTILIILLFSISCTPKLNGVGYSQKGYKKMKLTAKGPMYKEQKKRVKEQMIYNNPRQ